MLDENGSLYIFDVIFAVVLLLMAIMVINIAVVSLPSPHYSESVRDFKIAQDIMETLGGKIDSADRTFLGDISDVLAENENSKESVREVSAISKDKFSQFKLSNYRFSESNVLDGEVLAGSGDYGKAENVSVASRNYGDYSYTLSVW